VADTAAVAGYKLGAALARRLPERLAVGAAMLASVGFASAMRDRRHMVERHLRRADPTLSGRRLHRAVQEAFDSYAKYWVESFRLPYLSANEVFDGLKVEGWEHMQAGLDAGNGVIVALPHLGGWEWAGRWIADRSIPITVVVEPVQPPELFDWFVGLRSDLGMTVVPLGPQAAPAVAKALKHNSVVCLVCDRDLARTGIEVEFFGERTTLPGGPATLSLRTGAPIVPVGVYFSDEYRHVGICDPPVTIDRTKSLRADVTTMTQSLAHALELQIRRAPSQWHLMQPNWPSDPGW
jgi:KDO2-lipid IV(A) lauroyltransferase